MFFLLKKIINFDIIKTIIKFWRKEMNNKQIKIIVLAAIFIALNLICTRFFSIKITPTIRISFNLVVSAFCGYYLGPIWGGLTLFTEDLIGALLFPSGTFFIGFSISAALKGIMFGLILQNKKLTLSRIIIAFSFASIIISGFLDTFWLTILYRNPFIEGFTISSVLNAFNITLMPRLISIPILFVVNVLITYILSKTLITKLNHKNNLI